MFLRYIKFHNFRPFKGDQLVSFTNESGETDKTVTVLLGDNTYGKTTFVLAFIWCLYGESRFTMAQDILNKKVAMSLPSTPGMSSTAFVEVEFEDAGVIYTMKRSQKFTKTESGILKASETDPSLTFTTPAGETFSAGNTPAEIAMTIRQIMPKDLSSFFFFEGEKNNEITKKDLGQSVRTLLGLEAYSNMRTHLYGNHLNSSPSSSSVMGYYLSKQNSLSGNKAQEEYKKILEADAEINTLNNRLSEIDKEIDGYDGLIEELNTQLRLAEPTKQLQKRRDQISSELFDAHNDIEKKNKSLCESFGKDSLSLFLSPLLGPAKDKLSNMKVSDKSIRGIDIVGIRELLNRGYCLCGTDLKPGQAPYKSVQSYEDFVPPRELGGIISEMKDSIAQAEDTRIDFVNRFENLYSEIASLRIKIGNLEKEEKAISDEFKTRGEVDTKDAEETLLKYKRQRSDLTDEKVHKSSEIARWQTKKELATNNFNKYKAQNEKTREYETYYKYAEALYNWVNEQYSQKENSLRGELSNSISESFNRMFSGQKLSLKITEKYVVEMVYEGGIPIGDTGALRVIQYFAYVGSLVKLAKNIMSKHGDDQEEQEQLGGEYPLVLDAAFSHADEVHTESIARELANDSNQLILALMKKDWRYAKKGLDGKICRMYEFRKVDEAEVYIEEVE